MGKYTALWDYLNGQPVFPLTLSFSDIEKITGFKLDHSFLNCKKEPANYGLCAEKISLKNKTVTFIKINS